MSDIPGGKRLSIWRMGKDGGSRVNGLPRDPAHDVDAEFEAQIMDKIGQRAEAFSIRGRWKTVNSRHQPGIGVHFQRHKGPVGGIDGAGLIPLNIAYDIFPAVGFHMRSHVFGVAAQFCFGDSRSVTVPAVPSHGRSQCSKIFVHDCYPRSKV